MTLSSEPTLEEILENAFALTSSFLEELQRLRLKRSSMSKDIYREKEAVIVSSLEKFINEYKILSDLQWHDPHHNQPLSCRAASPLPLAGSTTADRLGGSQNHSRPLRSMCTILARSLDQQLPIPVEA